MLCYFVVWFVWFGLGGGHLKWGKTSNMTTSSPDVACKQTMSILQLALHVMSQASEVIKL